LESKYLTQNGFVKERNIKQVDLNKTGFNNAKTGFRNAKLVFRNAKKLNNYHLKT